MAITGAIGPLISVAIASARAASSSARKSSRAKNRAIIQTPRVMKAVKPTSIRAVCADSHTIHDAPHTNGARVAASGSTASSRCIFATAHSSSAKPRSDGITNGQSE